MQTGGTYVGSFDREAYKQPAMEARPLLQHYCGRRCAPFQGIKSGFYCVASLTIGRLSYPDLGYRQAAETHTEIGERRGVEEGQGVKDEYRNRIQTELNSSDDLSISS